LNSTRILNGAKQKLQSYNSQKSPNRKYYLDCLVAAGKPQTLVDSKGNVSDSNLQLIYKALRYYLGMNKFGVMGTREGFTSRLEVKLTDNNVQSILIKFTNVDILSVNITSYRKDAKQLYDHLSSPGPGGLSANGNSFCVGATKIMHLLYPNLFVILDSVMAEALWHNGYRKKRWQYNNFDTYWDEAMLCCLQELQAWGNTRGLLKLDTDEYTTLVRVFDKCRLYSVSTNTTRKTRQAVTNTLPSKKSAWLPMREAKSFALSKGYGKEVAEIESFRNIVKFNYPGSRPKKWRKYIRALYRKLFISRGVWGQFVSKYWPDHNKQIGQKACLEYNKLAQELLSQYPKTDKLLN